jgi:hypothetical protein
MNDELSSLNSRDGRRGGLRKIKKDLDNRNRLVLCWIGVRGGDIGACSRVVREPNTLVESQSEEG